MPDIPAQVEIPKRALFKAAEVCELAKVQPYVLRSWEAEFPALGVAKGEGAPRTYRRADVEQVLRIKHLLLVEGLTLAGARRRLTEVKRGLRSILSLLSDGGELRLTSPVAAPARVRSIPVKPTRGKASS